MWDGVQNLAVGVYYGRNKNVGLDLGGTPPRPHLRTTQTMLDTLLQ